MTGDPSRRWWIAGLLFAATMLNYLDRQVLSVTAPVLREEFHINATGYSLVVSAFLLAYTVMQSGAGRLIDAIGARLGLTLAIVWWSAAAALHAVAASAAQLGAFRFLLGIGEAGNWPAGVKLIREWFPSRERAFATGLFNSGSAIGALIAPPLIAWLTVRYSWRFAFLVAGGSGFLWLIHWWIVSRKTPSPAAEEADAAARAPWQEILGERRVWGLMAARFCADPVWWFYVFWLPDYLSSARHLSLAAIGASAWAPFLSADLGNLAGGWLSGKLMARGRSALQARLTVMAAGALVMTAGVAVTGAASATGAILLVCVVTFAYSAWAANILTLPSDVFDPRTVAFAVGLSGTAAGIGGILTTLAVGRVVDAFGYPAVFVAAGVLPLVGLGAAVWGLWRAANSQEKMEELV